MFGVLNMTFDLCHVCTSICSFRQHLGPFRTPFCAHITILEKNYYVLYTYQNPKWARLVFCNTYASAWFKIAACEGFETSM